VKIPVCLLNKKPKKMDTGSQHTTQVIRQMFCVEIILTGTQSDVLRIFTPPKTNGDLVF